MQLTLPEVTAGMAGFMRSLQQFEQAPLFFGEGAQDGGRFHGRQFARTGARCWSHQKKRQPELPLFFTCRT
jgi:hypothetical protein